MSSVNFMQLAHDESKKGGDPDRASSLALLAIAQAINNLADEVRGVGTMNQPVYVEVK